MLDNCRGGFLTNPILILIRTQGQRESRKEVGFRSPAEHLEAYEPGSFQFECDALIHYATLLKTWLIIEYGL